MILLVIKLGWSPRKFYLYSVWFHYYLLFIVYVNPSVWLGWNQAPKCVSFHIYYKGPKSNCSEVHVHIARSYWIKVHLHFWNFKILYIQLNWYLKVNCKVHICTCWYIFLYNKVKKIQILIYKNKICFVILLYRHFLQC